nr:hypothetical protein HUO10_005949 [Paraburkholderia busanensis]
MFDEPRKIVLVGVLAGAATAAAAVGITAYVSAVVLRSGWHALSVDESTLGGTRESTRAARADVISGTVTAGPRTAPADTALAGGLQAARESLQRNDLAAAQAHLAAVASTHQDDGRVVALQREVQARAMQQGVAVAQADPAGPSATEAGARRMSSTSSTASTKGHHSRERRHGTRDYSRHVSGDTRDAGKGRSNPPLATETAAAASGRVSRGTVAGAMASGSTARAGSAPPAALAPPALKVGQNAASLPAIPPPILQAPPHAVVEQLPSPNPPAELTAQTPPQSTALQPTAPSGTLLKSDGPKTRAQVRAEIARARDNGSLPAFGNPDPAGPGGAPSLTIAPRP